MTVREITTEIQRMGRRGDGVGSDEAVYIDGALPGEKVRARLEGERGWVEEVLSPSPDRTAPVCAHARSCGGCRLQHASNAFLSRWKQEQIVAALAAQQIEADVAAPIVSPIKSRRRAVFSARRTKKGALVGFHEARAASIVDVAQCEVLRPEITAALPSLRALARIAASRQGEIKITATSSEAGLDILVQGAKELDLPLRASAAQWAETADVARLSWNDEPLAARRPPSLQIGGARVTPPPGAFLQATQEGEDALAAIALKGAQGAKRIADLFAGCGAFALRLAQQAEVLAVEGAAPLVEALDHGWRTTQGLRKVAAVKRDLFRRPLGGAELRGIEAVVIDPPRAGAQAQMRMLAQEAPAELQRIVSISCDPSSFARDARILHLAGWRMGAVTPIDQFLWSPHIELAAVFER